MNRNTITPILTLFAVTTSLAFGLASCEKMSPQPPGPSPAPVVPAPSPVTSVAPSMPVSPPAAEQAKGEPTVPATSGAPAAVEVKK